MTHFSWKHHKKRTADRWLVRAACLARGNIDFQIAHPNLVKELLNDTIVDKIETKKWINKKLEKTFRFAEIPRPSVVVKRYNRFVQ